MPSPHHAFIAELQQHCRNYSRLHGLASQTYARRATKLTVINLFSSVAILFIASNENAQTAIGFLAANVWSFFFSEVQAESLDPGDLAIGIFGVIAVATAALQFLLKYEERNLIHKYVAADYENLVRKMGRYLLKETLTDDDLHRMNKQINSLARHSPPISSYINDHMQHSADRASTSYNTAQEAPGPNQPPAS